jgi:hypothetical protein
MSIFTQKSFLKLKQQRKFSILTIEFLKFPILIFLKIVQELVIIVLIIFLKALQGGLWTG